jgi:hypothetical protein
MVVEDLEDGLMASRSSTFTVTRDGDVAVSSNCWSLEKL